MTYQETLDYIYKKLPMFSRVGSAAYKKDLHNIRLICEHLGNPQKKFKSIHVAGTNGKGSVSHMLAAIFQTAGYKTGLHTSPHLHDFRERIKINGQLITEDFVTAFVERLKPLIEEVEPSFFEITVAMTFEAFAAQNLDIAIIEVGLGGRLDSTNIIMPEISVITNISWDHMNLLGNSLEAIATEKAGIIKQGSPVVIGETLPQTKSVFERIAAEKKAPAYWAEEHLKILRKQSTPFFLETVFEKQTGESFSVQSDLAGLYQALNVRTVLTAADALREKGWKLSEESILDALKDVKELTGLQGRWDVLQQSPMVVLDVAHNQNGIEKLVEQLGQLEFEELHLVMGVVKDKEVETILALLPADARYYFTQAHIPRALPAQELKQKAEAFNLSGDVYADVNLALSAAMEAAGNDDAIVVCGSIFLVAEVELSQYFNSPSRSNA
jgi:dihydrofolate synthase/folylpolyglutamate synthase